MDENEKKSIKYTDYVKYISNKKTKYVSIPYKICKNMNIESGEFIEITIKKM